MNNMRQFAKQLVLELLRAYKWAISPMFPPSCRYVPTCSEYAMEAVERYGVMRGAWMASWRLLRCHPFRKGGYDPVVVNRSETAEPCQSLPREVKGQTTSMFYRRSIVRSH